MRIVATLGGNALLERGERPDSDIQEEHVARPAFSGIRAGLAARQAASACALMPGR